MAEQPQQKMQITRGKIAKAQKVVIYGPEGIGKTTFCAMFPGVVFIDTEGSTAQMDVYRTDRPTSWTMLLKQVKSFVAHPPGGGYFKTLAIDTADWAEKLCVSEVCSKHSVKGIEDFGYGKGYTYSAEEFGKLLNHLQDLVDKGYNVVISAHAMMRKFEQPDEMGAYDRWELKCDKRVSAMLKEWADMVLFANYETRVISPENKMEKKKAVGNKRVMHTTHSSCWDAKNRFDLPDKLPLSFDGIAKFIPGAAEYVPPINPIPIAQSEAKSTPPERSEVPASSAPKEATAEVMRYPENCTAEEMIDKLEQMRIGPTEDSPISAAKDVPFYDTDEVPDCVPKELADLMRMDKVTLKEIQHAVSTRGYYPEGTSFTSYDPEFVQAVLVAAWEGVKNIIFKLREKEGNSHEF